MLIMRFLVAFFTIANRRARNAGGAIMREFDNMRYLLIAVVLSTLVGSVLVLAIRPSIGHSIWCTLPFWLFSAYRLFSSRRLIRLHLTGEVLEFFQALSRRIRGDVIEETGIFSNFFIDMYWNVISTTFLLQTALFLALPLYVNYTYGGITTAIIIVMLLVIIAIDNMPLLNRAVRKAVNVTVVIYIIGLIFVLFPHTGFYLGGLTKRVNVVNASTAKKMNELENLQEEQRENIDNQFIDGIIAWQKKHPGQELPPEYQARLDRARQLKLL